MQVQYFCRAGSFMKVINILCDDLYFEIFFEFSQSDMSFVGYCRFHIAAAHIIKIEHQGWIFLPCPGCGDFSDFISFPKSVAVSKVRRPLSALMPAPVNTTNFFFFEATDYGDIFLLFFTCKFHDHLPFFLTYGLHR